MLVQMGSAGNRQQLLAGIRFSTLRWVATPPGSSVNGIANAAPAVATGNHNGLDVLSVILRIHPACARAAIAGLRFNPYSFVTVVVASLLAGTFGYDPAPTFNASAISKPAWAVAPGEYRCVRHQVINDDKLVWTPPVVGTAVSQINMPKPSQGGEFNSHDDTDCCSSLSDLRHVRIPQCSALCINLNRHGCWKTN